MRQKTPNCERFFSLKISWDRARAERAILRVFGGIRAAGVGPKTILKIERRTAKKTDKICGEKNRGAARDDARIWTRTRITQSPPRV